jgi:hypothetical protein
VPAWMPWSWESFERLILQGAALFVIATFVFDATHFGLHLFLRSRYRWLRWLASPHQAHHDFFDGLLRYHDEALFPNLLHLVIPEYATPILVLPSRPIRGFTSISSTAIPEGLFSSTLAFLLR